MDIRRIAADQLTSDQIAAWSEIQRAEPTLASPFFRPEFTQAVAAVRSDIEIAILKKGGQSIGFLPYQRSRWNVARPVGGNLSDYHGLVAPAHVKCKPLDVLRACRLKAWHFDHLLCEQESIASYAWRQADSPFIDLPGGADDYFIGRENGRRLKYEYGQKKRKLERAVGPLRYVADGADRAPIPTLVEWKREQYRRTNVPDIFAYPWVLELLDKLLEYSSEDFSPVVSAMYAGDTIASIHYGLRSRTLLHSWFPTYSLDLGQYSPGTLHWIESIKSAESLGVRRIDLGKGPESYKRRLMTGANFVAEGTVDARPGAAMIRRAWWNTRERIRNSRLATPARVPAQVVFRVKHWLDAK